MTHVSVHVAATSLSNPVEAATGSHGARASLFLCLSDAGGVGWAECPVAMAEGVDPTQAMLLEALRGELNATSGAAPWSSVARGLVATARLDERLRGEGRSLVDELGVHDDAVGFAGVVGIDSPARAAERAVELVESGATRIRVKVGPAASAASVQAVLGAVAVPVVADANGSFTSPSDPVLLALAESPLAWLEQPFAPGREHDAAQLRNRGLPIGADESVTSMDAIERLATGGVVSVICVKPSRFGVPRTIEVLERSKELGLAAYLGGYFETGLARAALGALSARYGDYDGDVAAPSTYLDVDPCGLEPPRNGRQPLHRGPGIGPLPAAEALSLCMEAELPCEDRGAVS